MYNLCYTVYTMTKDLILNIRIDEFDQVLLEKLCEETVRTKSDMVRYLIRKEYDQRVTTDEPPSNRRYSAE